MGSQNRWIWTLVQGIVALALGIWTLVGRGSALTALQYAAASYLLIAGSLGTINALMNRSRPDSRTELIRGLIGLIGGAIVLILALFTSASLGTIFTVLAIALIAYGAMGLFATLFARGGKPFEWGPVFVSALLVVLGILVFVDQSNEVDLVTWTGAILTLIGIVIILYAILRQRTHTEVTTAA